MAYLHKYVIEGETFYRKTGSNSTPSDQIILKASSHVNVVSLGKGVAQSIKRIEDAFAGKDGTEEVVEKDTEKDTEKGEKKAVTRNLDYVAGKIEKVNPRLALAIDQISDEIDKE